MSRDNLEKMISVSRGIRADIHDETRTEIEGLKNRNSKKSDNLKMTKRGKAMLTAFLVSVTGWIGVGQLKEYKYQKDIDKYNESVLMLVPPENLKFNEEDKMKSVRYLSAVDKYLNGDLDENEEKQCEDIIYNTVVTGDAIELEEKVMARQLDIAKKLGDAKSIDEHDSKDTELTFYNNVGEDNGFRISGVTGEYYPVEGLRIFENDVPKNLINSAKDCIKYGDMNWSNMDRDECVEVGIQIAQNTETLMNEHYIITDKGIERINNKDFKELAEEYNEKEKEKSEKQRESIYNKYGVSVEKMSDIINTDDDVPEL